MYGVLTTTTAVGVAIGDDCWYGYFCRTQTHRREHAQRLNVSSLSFSTLPSIRRLATPASCRLVRSRRLAPPDRVLTLRRY